MGKPQGIGPPSMTVSLAEHVASPYMFTAVQRYRSESSPISLLICREAEGRGHRAGESRVSIAHPCSVCQP